MFRITIPSTDFLDEAALKLLETFPENRVFAFFGEMGSGKTTFIKALCRVLQVSDITSSPSFGLIHEYRSVTGDSVYHFDFYRVEKIDEVYDIGYEEYMYGGDYCFLEWPEKDCFCRAEWDSILRNIRVKEDESLFMVILFL